MRYKFFACIFTVFLLNNLLHAQENGQAKIDSLMQQAFRKGLFNGNVLVVDHDKVVYKAAIGFADASKTTRLTEGHRFHIGSIAKEFNAVSIMLLKEQGKLNLDDKVAQYLPELPSWAKGIRIQDLLGYTSGLPDVKWKTVRSDKANMNDLMQVEKLDFEPGTRYAYNNNNVFLQRRIIEKITGLSFTGFVQQKLLAPTRMIHAVIDPAEPDALVARAFNDAGKQDSLFMPISGWVAVTLDDFYKWAKNIVQYKIISPASTRFLLIPYSPSRQSGLGSNGQMTGDKIINFVHDGTARNYQALLVCNPQKGRTVILMTNNKHDILGYFNDAIQNILDGKPYLMPKKQVLSLFQDKIDSIKSEQILPYYNQLKKEHGDSYAFDSENALNELGYYLLKKGRIDDAILIFKQNTVLFPESGNVFDSLAEAYYTKGDKQNALINYKRALVLDPANVNAKKIIAELER